MIGVRVESDLRPGLGATVVNMNPPSGRWPRHEPTFDVLWDDGQCTRRVANSVLLGAAWRRRQEPRLSPAECTNRWYDYLVALSRDMQHRYCGQHAASSPAEPALPIAAATSSLAQAVAQLAQQVPVPSARAVREAAKQQLAQRFPGIQFAVHCERRALTVSWMDGPLPGTIWKLMQDQVDPRRVERIRADRALSEFFVQAAIDYVLWRARVDDSERAHLALRATPQAFMEGALQFVRLDRGPAAGMTLQDLLRVVIDRWDDCAETFRNTRRTQGLAMESRAMFPVPAAAAADFLTFRAAVLERALRGRQALDQIAAPRAERERL
jgi:hypothetical protein